jgi:hypothetical protein
MNRNKPFGLNDIYAEYVDEEIKEEIKIFTLFMNNEGFAGKFKIKDMENDFKGYYDSFSYQFFKLSYYIKEFKTALKEEINKIIKPFGIRIKE